MELSDIIRRARAQKKITQRKLAAMAGVTPGAVAQWEGGGGIKIENMSAVKSALGLDVMPPQPGSAPYKGMIIEDPDELSLIGFWRDLDRDEQAVFRKRLFKPPTRREISAVQQADDDN